MNLIPTDLILRKTNGQEAVWVSQRLLMEVCGVSEEYFRISRIRYKSSVRACDRAKAGSFLPDSGKAWRWGKTAQGFYYCYNNIPDKKPAEYRSKLGTETFLKEQLNLLENSIKADLNKEISHRLILEARKGVRNEDIAYYMYYADVLHSKTKATEMATALSWLRLLNHYYTEGGYKMLGLAKKQDFLTIATAVLEKADLYGFKISSEAYLRRKITDFPQEVQEQRASLVSEKYNNDNARKVGKDQLVDTETGEIFPIDYHQAVMFNAYMRPGMTTKESIRSSYVDYYTPAIQEFGYEPIAYRTFCHHLARLNTKLLLDKERHGADYYKKHFLTYVPTKKLQYSHSLFAGDGSGTISYRYMRKKSNGKVVESTMKLYVLMITDIASRKIVGWAPAPKGQHKESPDMLEKAVKMAVNNCDRHTMFEFISDNHGAFTAAESKDLLDLVFRRVRTIEPGNSQANPAETEFRLFKQALKSELNFISSSWDSGIEGQSNPDYLKLEDLPSYEDAIIQFYDIVEKWNNRPLRDGISPNQRFENRNPKAAPMDARILRLLYGEKTKVDPTYMRGYIQVSKTHGYEERENYLFEIEDYHDTGAEKLAKAFGYKKRGQVQVVWDEEAADLYTLDGVYIMTCLPALLASQSYIEADETNKEALKYHRDKKKKALEKADEYSAMLRDIMSELDKEEAPMEEEEETVQDIPYIHQMKTGGNKESYNRQMDEATKPEELKKLRINRDFDEDKYKNL